MNPGSSPQSLPPGNLGVLSLSDAWCSFSPSLSSESSLTED